MQYSRDQSQVSSTKMVYYNEWQLLADTEQRFFQVPRTLRIHLQHLGSNCGWVLLALVSRIRRYGVEDS